MLKVPVDCWKGASRGRIREGGGGVLLLTLRRRWRRPFDILLSKRINSSTDSRMDFKHVK